MPTKISIIVPVYNVEKVFPRCLESVKNQTFIDFECILVDDASPDNSPAICDEYAQKDKRFIVIHKPQNEGLPKARKSGLDIAKGEFVVHLDSDDWLELNALEVLYKKQQETNADIIVGQFKNIYKDSESINRKVDNQFGDHVIELFLVSSTRRIWGKLYRRSLFDNYIVPSASMAEDLFTNVQILSRLEYHKQCEIDDVIYNYDRTTGMLEKSRANKYLAMEDFLNYRNYKDIEDYLQIKSQKNQDIVSAYKTAFFNGLIVRYLRSNKHISYDEIQHFYYDYYIESRKYHAYIPLKYKISMIFLFYFGKCKFLVTLHCFFMNFAVNIKHLFFPL